jgi:hypothetical protein
VIFLYGEVFFFLTRHLLGDPFTKPSEKDVEKPNLRGRSAFLDYRKKKINKGKFGFRNEK